MVRVEKAFDVEKARKMFYERFQREHTIFLSAIRGRDELNVQEAEKQIWYTSVLLNRLMFLYFLQKQGFLDTQNVGIDNGDTNYLRTRLHMMQRYKEEADHVTYYRFFLLRLFHAGLSKRERTAEMERLFGKVPYLNHELFHMHELERDGGVIEIADEAFERVFNFFDEFEWTVEKRPLHNEREINPDMLGYVFEKYINLRQMGAYYTREDVTAYIARNSILPALFDMFAQVYPQMLATEGTLWHLLRQNPERYIQEAIRRKEYLPTELEWEYTERRAYYRQLREKIESGELCCIDDFITYNLDISLFALDMLHNIDEPKVLNALYECLQKMTILDPTCGSGAFLCEALWILVPIYEACLERMNVLLEGSESPVPSVGQIPMSPYPSAGQAQGPLPASPHPLAPTVLGAIIGNNLYGVDIMEEATELCKLRLLLLVMGVIKQREEIVVLGEIDFHIQVGNALVGFVRERGLKEKEGGERKKEEVRRELDWKLAQEYGIKEGDSKHFEIWHKSHKPFHWALEFADVWSREGFTCIIGNPPYVEYAEKRFPYFLQHFSTIACGNLYPCVIERSRSLLAAQGRLGMIVPLAAFATRNMLPLIEGIEQWFVQKWISFYHFRPSMLFSGGKIASIPTTIMLASVSGQKQKFSTSILKWTTEKRHFLFSTLKYCQITAPGDPANPYYYAKFGHECENSIMQKVLQQRCVKEYRTKTPNENKMFYRSAGGLYWKVFLNFSWPYKTTSNKQCMFQEKYERDVFVALFNSSLFWWYYSVTFDTFNLKDYMLFGFRFTYPKDERVVSELCEQSERLMESFRSNAQHLTRSGTGSYTIYARKSKQILDEIDTILAQHYGFSAEELDFIVHYDIKYRMGLK